MIKNRSSSLVPRHVFPVEPSKGTGLHLGYKSSVEAEIEEGTAAAWGEGLLHWSLKKGVGAEEKDPAKTEREGLRSV